MSFITVVDTPAATLKYHPDEKVVHHEFHTFMYGDAFRDVMNKGVEVLKTRGAHKWLSDDRGNSATTPEDTEWAANVWFPSAIAAGWKHWAIVMPVKLAGQMNMKRRIDQWRAVGVNAEIFENPESALAWLAKQP
jgi:hypothetical protein